MARIVQLFLPLVIAVFAEAQLDHMPHLARLQHASSKLDVNEQKQTLDKLGKDLNINSWFRHFMEQRHPGLSDGPMYSYDSHQQKSDENYNPFFFEDKDPYIGNPYFAPTSSITFPGISNSINMPDKGLNSDNHLSLQGNIKTQEKKPDKNATSDKEANDSKDKPSNVSPTDKQATEMDNDHKSSDVNKPSIPNNPNELRPKTNEIKKNDTLENKDKKDDKNLDINKKKDYLLVGSGNNGNNLYLLHENKANPTTVPILSANQPSNNMVYVPYYSGQSSNPVSQVNNGQPTNLQVSPNKINVNGYNNGVANTPQPINTDNQNPGYVLVYSNGQLVQVPGIVVNTPQNNLPVQSNSVQPTNYIIANAVPNNVPATQNSGSNVIYATLPNQGSNSPMYIQIPNNCNQGMPNNICSGTVVQNPVQRVNNAANVMSNNGLVSNYANQPNQNMAQPAILLTNGVSNSYAQQAILPQAMNAVSIPQGVMYSYQNTQPQSAVQIPYNAGSNQYNQPIPLSQGSNAAVQIPMNAGSNQYNQPIPLSQGSNAAVQIPMNAGSNQYNQPMPLSQGSNAAVQIPMNAGSNQYNQPIPLSQGSNAAVQLPMNAGSNQYNQPMPLSQGSNAAVQIPMNAGSNQYNQPIPLSQGSNVAVNTPNAGAVNNQNIKLEPVALIPVGTESYRDNNTSHQVVIPAQNQGDESNKDLQIQAQVTQGAGGIVNEPNLDKVARPDIDIRNAVPSLPSKDSVPLDDNSMIALGAQPAIMITGFKETTGDKKDKKNGKDKKEKKDKSKKKDKKNKDSGESNEQEPLTNKKK